MSLRSHTFEIEQYPSSEKRIPSKGFDALFIRDVKWAIHALGTRDVDFDAAPSNSSIVYYFYGKNNLVKFMEEFVKPCFSATAYNKKQRQPRKKSVASDSDSVQVSDPEIQAELEKFDRMLGSPNSRG